MAGGRGERRRAYLGKVEAEVAGLVRRGVACGGNACSELLVLCGDDRAAEEGADAPDPLGEPTRAALKAALARLGYPPECWEWLGTRTPGEPLAPALLREAVCTLDPASVAIVDASARADFANAYADELAALPGLDEAMLEQGHVADVLGMRVCYVGDFARGLADEHQKQLLWHALKRLRPLGEPY